MNEINLHWGEPTREQMERLARRNLRSMEKAVLRMYEDARAAGYTKRAAALENAARAILLAMYAYVGDCYCQVTGDYDFDRDCHDARCPDSDDFDGAPCCSGMATSGGDPQSCNCGMPSAE